jgi:hypothetical protein
MCRSGSGITPSPDPLGIPPYFATKADPNRSSATYGSRSPRLVDLREVSDLIAAAFAEPGQGGEEEPLQGRRWHWWEPEDDHVAVMVRHDRAHEQRAGALREPVAGDLAGPAEGCGVLEELLKR